MAQRTSGLSCRLKPQLNTATKHEKRVKNKKNTGGGVRCIELNTPVFMFL
jgi:hypothetical protein